MSRAATLAILLFSSLFFSSGLSAQQYGTAQQAKAMLERAVAAVKADRAAALAAFNKPTGEFRDRDLYVFCIGPNGAIITHATPAMLGVDLKGLKDANGSVSYAFPRPGESQPTPKESYVTKVGDLVCGVGYYQ